MKTSRICSKPSVKRKAEGCKCVGRIPRQLRSWDPETLIAKNFDGPCMFCLLPLKATVIWSHGRGDAYCGMLNCSYNWNAPPPKATSPEYPVGTADDIASMMADFVPVACAIIGPKGLKIITFGPRPQDFFACNAPIKGLYRDRCRNVTNRGKLWVGSARFLQGTWEWCPYRRYLQRRWLQRWAKVNIIRTEPPHGAVWTTPTDWAENHKGSREYVAFADKCWPAFLSQFGFEPCYVNSRLVSRGIPVSCEVDIYGALSEYIGMRIRWYRDTARHQQFRGQIHHDEDIKGKYNYSLTDTFMDSHCGNTPECKDVRHTRHQISVDTEPSARKVAANPTSPVVHWKATSLPATSPSIVCSATGTVCLFLHRRRRGARCSYPFIGGNRYFGLSLRWDVSTVMYWFRNVILTMVR